MDGLVELGGVIVHRHHRVTVEVVGLADIDGPVSGLARAHDHHRAVGVLVGVAPQPLPQRVVQEEPPCQAAAAHQQKDEDGGHNIGRIEEHAMDEGAVDQIDDDGGHADHPGQPDEIALPCILPQDGVEPPCQKADEVHGHDPGQVVVEQGSVMGPPGGFHGTIRPQEQGKVKAEHNDDGIH